MTTYGLTSEGFVVKPLSVIESEITEDLKGVFGAQINTSDQSVFGQLKGLYAEREALLWELMGDIYNSQYPDTAENVSLDHASSLTSHKRLEATYSIIEGVVVGGVEGTVVTTDEIFSVDGNSDAQFSPQEGVTIGEDGTATVDCIALETGPIEAEAGTLTNIDTPISGLTSVTNPNAATVGRDTETDAEFRIRRKANLQVSKSGPGDAIRKAILALNDNGTEPSIEYVRVFENDYGEYDNRGLPPHSIMAVVYQENGSTDRDQEIAEIIMLKAKSGGIRPFGDVSLTVYDSEGFPHTCWFARPAEIPIYLEIDLVISSDYPEDGDDALKEAIVSWGNALGTGQDIIVYPALMSQLSGAGGITKATVRIGKEAGPTEDDNINIDDGVGGSVEISRWSADNITIAHA